MNKLNHAANSISTFTMRVSAAKSIVIYAVTIIAIVIAELPMLFVSYAMEENYSNLRISVPTLKDSEGKIVPIPLRGHQVLISTEIANFSNTDIIAPVVIVEVRDGSGLTVFLDWTIANANTSGMLAIDSVWTPDKAGDYQLRAFAISNFTHPLVLTEIVRSEVRIYPEDTNKNDNSLVNEITGYNRTIVIIGEEVLLADVAKTVKQRELGLSVKQDLLENQAMLFVFDRESSHTFWMKGMQFPIDIIWIDSNKRIVHMEHSLSPCKTESECPTYTPNQDSLYVLETVSGYAKKHSIDEGDRVRLIDCDDTSSSLCLDD